MKINTQLKLSAMMLLEFFIWGGWFVTLGTFLGNNLSASGAKTGMVYSIQSREVIITPFIIGLMADRFFGSVIKDINLYFCKKQMKHLENILCRYCDSADLQKNGKMEEEQIRLLVCTSENID